jgi:uncharacterized tellurite resistance protein B-like protein
MADWKKLLKDLLLADGVIDASEAGLLKEEILADGVVDQEEVEFLVDLRNSAKSTSAEFNEFFFDSLKSNILEDGVIDSDEARKLREIIFADGVVDEDEKKFLQSLKEGAKEVSPEFNTLFDECMK